MTLNSTTPTRIPRVTQEYQAEVHQAPLPAEPYPPSHQTSGPGHPRTTGGRRQQMVWTDPTTGLTTDKDLLMAMVNRPQVLTSSTRSDCKEFNDRGNQRQSTSIRRKLGVIRKP